MSLLHLLLDAAVLAFHLPPPLLHLPSQDLVPAHHNGGEDVGHRQLDDDHAHENLAELDAPLAPVGERIVEDPRLQPLAGVRLGLEGLQRHEHDGQHRGDDRAQLRDEAQEEARDGYEARHVHTKVNEQGQDAPRIHCVDDDHGQEVVPYDLIDVLLHLHQRLILPLHETVIPALQVGLLLYPAPGQDPEGPRLQRVAVDVHRHKQPQEGVEEEEHQAERDGLCPGDDGLETRADVRLEAVNQRLGPKVLLEPLQRVQRLVLEGRGHDLRKPVEMVVREAHDPQELVLVAAELGQHGLDVGHDERVQRNQRSDQQGQGHQHSDEPQHGVLPRIAAVPSALQHGPAAQLGHVRPGFCLHPRASSIALFDATGGVEAVASPVEEENRQSQKKPELVGEDGDEVSNLPKEHLPALHKPLQN
mmetsp:Transcript_93356/g.273301  ORF Transcript_93356/g.273301 Transcript_93356/m.273301 type:complete len:418 (+) Transcript_93356:257-1510(+)